MKVQSGKMPRWVSLLVYVALSVLMTWPLVQHLNTRLAGRDTDIFNVYWGNWWVRQALFSGQNPYFTQYLLYPVGFDLTTFAFSPFLAMLWIPLAAITSSVAAYNTVVLATIVLNCAAMDHLVRYLTGNARAALVAGITLGFAPCLAAERAAHLNLSVIAWIPWTAFLLTRLMREAKARDAILLAVTIGLSFLTRLHVGALVLMFDGIYLVGLASVERKRWHRLAIRGLLLAALLSLLILSPLLFHLQQILNQPGGETLVREGAERQQTDVLAYFVPPPQHTFLGTWTEPIYEKRFAENAGYWAYIGFIPLLLALYAMRSRLKAALPWALAGLFFVVLALGPSLRFNGRIYDAIKLPYGLAPDLFAGIGFDVPNRFNLAMMPALAVLVGLACDRLDRSWLVPVAAGLIVLEYLIVPLPLMHLPPGSLFYDQLAADGQDYAIVDLPLQRAEGEFHRYYQTLHHKPIVGGWDHRVPASAFAFIDHNPLLAAWRTPASRAPTLPPALAELSEANVRYFVLHKDQLRALPEGVRSLLLALRPVYEDDSVYVLPTGANPISDYHIAHDFGEGIRLLAPIATLAADQAGPALFLDTYWLLDGIRAGDAGCQVTLTDPNGAVVARKSMPLSPAAQSPASQTWSFVLPPTFLPGLYRIAITPLSGTRALGTWTTELPVLEARGTDGTSLPLLGHPFPVAFDAPIEMIGYHITAGDDILWLDLYWRGLTDHQRAYVLFVQLLDPVTRKPVTRTGDDVIQKLEWMAGEIVHERRILMINDMPQGQYDLTVGLYPAGEPDHRIAASDPHTGKRWPGEQVTLDLPVLVLPRTLQDTPVSSEGRIVVYTTAGEQMAPGAPDQAQASFGNVARLLGYSLNPQQATAGQDLELTLYWESIAPQSTDGDYTVFVHLLDESSHMIAQHDGKPARGTRPTSTWKQGDRIVDTHNLTWLVQDYEGIATIEVGLYQLETQVRLPAYSATGERLPDDQVRLARIRVSD